MTTLRKFCIRHNACEPGIDWLGNRSPALAYADCEHPGYFLWVCALLPGLREAVIRCAFKAVDLAVRKYAPIALDAAGMSENAAALQALPAITDAEAMQEAALEARAARAEAAEAAWKAQRAAGSVGSAWASRAQILKARMCEDATLAAEWAWRAADVANKALQTNGERWATRAAEAMVQASLSNAASATAEVEVTAPAEILAFCREQIPLDAFLKACAAAGVDC